MEGCSGADVEAACNSAFEFALTRQFPDLGLLNADHSSNISVPLTVADFQRAVAERVGAAARVTSRFSAPLPQLVVPVLSDGLLDAQSKLAAIFPPTLYNPTPGKSSLLSGRISVRR